MKRLEALADLEQELDATKWASELREASIAQGRGRLRMMEKLNTSAELTQSPSTLIAPYKHCSENTVNASQTVFGHHCVVSALQYVAVGIPESAGLATYGYQNFSEFCFRLHQVAAHQS